jgi:hypothetical protein
MRKSNRPANVHLQGQKLASDAQGVIGCRPLPPVGKGKARERYESDRYPIRGAVERLGQRQSAQPASLGNCHPLPLCLPATPYAH